MSKPPRNLTNRIVRDLVNENKIGIEFFGLHASFDYNINITGEIRCRSLLSEINEIAIETRVYDNEDILVDFDTRVLNKSVFNKSTLFTAVLTKHKNLVNNIKINVRYNEIDITSRIEQPEEILEKLNLKLRGLRAVFHYPGTLNGFLTITGELISTFNQSLSCEELQLNIAAFNWTGQVVGTTSTIFSKYGFIQSDYFNEDMYIDEIPKKIKISFYVTK